MYMYMHIYMCLYIYIYLFIYMSMYICMCICIYIYIYVYGLVKEWVVGTRKLNPYHNLRHLWLTLFIEHVEHHVDDAPL